jgi:hypothetical protein
MCRRFRTPLQFRCTRHTRPLCTAPTSHNGKCFHHLVWVFSPSYLLSLCAFEFCLLVLFFLLVVSFHQVGGLHLGRIFSTLRSFQTQPIRRPLEVQNRRRSSLIQLSLLCLHCIQYPTTGDFRTTSKMRDNILLTYVIVDLLFVVSGGLLLIFALETESMTTDAPTVTTVARNLLLMQCPLSGPSSQALL